MQSPPPARPPHTTTAARAWSQIPHSRPTNRVGRHSTDHLAPASSEHKAQGSQNGSHMLGLGLGLGLTQSQSPRAAAAMVPTRSGGDELMEDVSMTSTASLESLAQRFDSALHLSYTNTNTNTNHSQSDSSSYPTAASTNTHYAYCNSNSNSAAPQTQTHPPQIFPRRSSALILPPPPSPDLALPHHQRGATSSDGPSVHLLSDDGHSQIPLRALSTGRTSTKPCHARTSAADLPIAELLRLLFPLASSSAAARTMSANTHRRRDRSVTPPSHLARGSCAPPSSPILASCDPSSSFTPTNAPPNSPLSLAPAFAASAADMADDVRMAGSSSPTHGFADDMMAMDLGPPSLPHPTMALSPPSPFPPHPPTPPTPTPTVSDLHLAMSQYNPPVPSLTTDFGGCGYGITMSSSMPSTGFESPVMSHAMGNAMMHLPASPPLSPKCASALPKAKRKPAAAAASPPPTMSSHRGKSHHYHSKRRPSRTRSSSSAAALAVLSGVSTASTSSISKRTAAAAASASTAAPSGAEKVRQQRRVRAMVKNLARQLDGLCMD